MESDEEIELGGDSAQSGSEKEDSVVVKQGPEKSSEEEGRVESGEEPEASHHEEADEEEEAVDLGQSDEGGEDDLARSSEDVQGAPQSDHDEKPEDDSHDDAKAPLENAEEPKEPPPQDVQGAEPTDSAVVSKKKPHHKKDLLEEPRFSPSRIPMMTRDSVNRETYDLGQLLDPKVQKQLEAGHRFLAPPPYAVPRARSQSPQSSRDFIQLNITNVVANKSSLRISLDHGIPSAGILMTGSAKEQHKEPPDIQHFWEFRTRAQLKTDRLSEELKTREMAECTFHPSIIPNSVEKPVRSSLDYYKEMIAYRKRTEEKLKTLQEESDKVAHEEEGKYFHPSLCEQSRKMDVATTEPRFERLYQLHKGKMQKQIKATGVPEEVPSQDSLASDQTDAPGSKPFHPVINKRSQNLTRPMPVDQHLYQEALSRAEKMRANAPQPRELEKLISSSSESLLIEKFQVELDEKWQLLSGGREDIGYMKFVELLLHLSFIENNPENRLYEQERDLVLKAWNSFGLAPEQRVPKKQLETLLYSIMNFFVSTMAAPEPGPEGAGEEVPVPSQPEGVYTTPEKAAKMHVVFRPLYEHRMGKLDKSNINPTYRFNYDHPFKPTVNKASASMVADRRGGKVEDALIGSVQKKKEHQEQLKAKVDKAAMKDCRFKPEVNKKSKKIIGTVENYSRDSLSIDYIKMRKGDAKMRNETLYQLAAIAQERKKKTEKTPEDVESEMNMVECTFAPDLSKTRGTDSEALRKEENKNWGAEKGADKTVERMKKAREEAERVKLMTQRGFPHPHEVSPVRFTVDHKHKLIPVFDPRKAPPKKVGVTGAKSSPKAVKAEPKVKKAVEPSPGNVVPEASEPVLVQTENPPVETQSSAPVYSEIRETSSEEVKSEESEPVLTIAVSLSETEKDNINYYPGDKVEDLARKFVEKHGLREEDVEKLTQLISSKMQEQVSE